MNARELVRRHAFLAALTDDEARELLKGAHTRTLQAGETLFRTNDPGDMLFGVLAGCILIVVESESGKELVLNRHGAGEIFGEIALLDGQGRSATAVAYEPTQLIQIDRATLLAFLRLRPDAMLRMIGLLCGRLRRVTHLVEDSTFLDLSARLAKQLLALIGSSGSGSGDAAATLSLSQSDLAQMLGVTREAVSKQLSLWREAGIVALGRRRLTVRNARALAKISADGH
jgi:CRP/FNR family cyclic AMP-dependent transcriptional regulator